jgi:outer membrane murein-binding lipoprotein Lpp
MMAGAMPDNCKAMMAKHEQMMSDMQAMNTALDQKLATMEKATGPAKVDAMAAVITEMVAQRKQMQQKMMAMRSDMMTHMGAHMRGTPPGSKAGPMMDCPMMKGSSGAAQ